MAYTLLYLSGIADTRAEAEALTPTSGTIFYCKDTEEYIRYNGSSWGDLVYGDIDKVHVDSVETNADKNFISDIERAEWDAKQDALVSGTNIKTINGTSLLGSGNITISGSGLVDGDYGDVEVSASGTVMTVPDLNNKLDTPTGTPDGTKYLRDDNTWQPVSGSGLTQYQVRRIIRR